MNEGDRMARVQEFMRNADPAMLDRIQQMGGPGGFGGPGGMGGGPGGFGGRGGPGGFGGGPGGFGGGGGRGGFGGGGRGGGYVQAYEHPTLHRHRALYTDRMLEACAAQPPDWGAEAGSSRGDHYTPWKQCCRALLTAARETPGITLKSILSDTRFHYQTQASARTSLSKWLREGKVRGVVVRLEGRNLCLYPTQEPPQANHDGPRNVP
jgi:hypothetical protein